MRNSLERAQMNPKNWPSLAEEKGVIKVCLQNMAVSQKSFNRKKPIDDNVTPPVVS